VCKAHRLLCHSTLGVRVIKKKRDLVKLRGGGAVHLVGNPLELEQVMVELGRRVREARGEGGRGARREGARAWGGRARALRPQLYVEVVVVLRTRSGFGFAVVSRVTRGTVTSTMRRAAHPSGCARCGAGAGCSAIKYQSLSRV